MHISQNWSFNIQLRKPIFFVLSCAISIGVGKRFNVWTHNERSVSYPVKLLLRRMPGYCAFFSGAFAFQTDTHMCSVFHPWTNSNPRPQLPSDPRETVSQVPTKPPV